MPTAVDNNPPEDEKQVVALSIEEAIELPPLDSPAELLQLLFSGMGWSAPTRIADTIAFFICLSSASGASATNAIALKSIGIFSANIGILAAMTSMLTDPITEAMLSKEPERIKQAFVTTHVLALPTSLLLTLLNQSYASLFPLENAEAQQAIATFPLKILPAMWCLFTAMNQYNFGICDQDAGALAGVYLPSPLMLLLPFYQLKKYMQPYDSLVVADSIGLFYLVAAYFATIVLRPSKRFLISGFTNVSYLKQGLKDSVAIFKSGLQLALPEIANLVSFLLTTHFLSNEDEANAYLLCLFFPNALVTLSLGLLSVTINVTKIYSVKFNDKARVLFPAALQRYYYCASSFGSILPVAILMAVLIDPQGIIKNVLGADGQNDVVKNKMIQIFPWAVCLAGLKVFNAIPQGKVIAFGHQPLFPWLRHMTSALVSANPLISFAVGLLLTTQGSMSAALAYFIGMNISSLGSHIGLLALEQYAVKKLVSVESAERQSCLSSFWRVAAYCGEALVNVFSCCRRRQQLNR